MACPYFLPQTPLKDFSNLYAGSCAAKGAGTIAADMIEMCNYGYVRGACACAAGSESDALRFLVRSQESGIVQVAWSSERDHHPVAVGVLALREGECGDSPLAVQARCVASEFLLHKGRS